MTFSIPTSAFVASRHRGFAVVLASVLLSACGVLPTQVDRPFSPARQPSADSPLVQIAQNSSPELTLTGFRLLRDGFYSLDARIQLVRRAHDSLDVQYYLSNFVDMDVFLVGPVVHQLASIFDTYWKSLQAYSADAIIGEPADSEETRRSFDHLVDDGEQMRSIALPPFDILGYGPISDDLDVGRLGLVCGTAVAFADQPAKVMATSAEMARSMSAQMNVMDRVMEAKSEVVISSPYLIPGSIGVQAFGDLRKRDVKVTILTNSFAANDVPLAHTGCSRYRVELLRTGIDIYELSPTRIQHNEQLMLPGMSLGRLHAKAAVIDQSMVYIGSVNLDPRSESTNTELGLVAKCPELAKEVIRVINISKLQSSYRLRFGADGQSLEWLATDDQGEVVLSQEPEVTPFMRLETMLLAPFVPEQLL
jgi:putative cardiolipin synthase